MANELIKMIDQYQSKFTDESIPFLVIPDDQIIPMMEKAIKRGHPIDDEDLKPFLKDLPPDALI